MSRPTSLPDGWRELSEALGGVRQLAEALGTVPRVVNLWAHDERVPRGPSRLLIRQLFESHNIKSPI